MFAHPNISPLRNRLMSTSFTASQNVSFITHISKQSLRSQTIEQILEAFVDNSTMHGADRSTFAYRNNMWLAGNYSCKISTSYLPYQSILSLLLRIAEMKRRNTPQRRYFQLRAIFITRSVAIRARLNSVT